MASLSPDAQKLLDKWREIIADYEANVTHIYGREVFHMLFDVVMHSVIGFRFKDQPVQRGWVEALIAGDTKCGKSATAATLARHYQLSPPVQCERASMPGVLGGILQEGGGRQSVIWGAIPRQDKRAVILEEVTGLKPDEISQMSDCRSSGIASIVKIQAERTMARTRKLWLSNPRTDRNRKMHTYMYGIMVIPEIIGRAEDISRFDIATGASSEEVPVSVLNAKDHPRVEHKYTSEAAHTLIFWAWTRRPEQVVFEEGVEDTILEMASSMSEEYSSQIPLVEPGEQRLRIARIACALACRFHSTGDGEDVRVQSRHVELANWLFHHCYDREAFGYKAYSRSRRSLDELHDEDYIKIKEYFDGIGNAYSILKSMETCGDMTRFPMVSYQDLPKLLSALVEYGLAEMGEKGLLMTRKMRLFLERRGKDTTKIVDRSI